jgi:hypothetical protein
MNEYNENKNVLFLDLFLIAKVVKHDLKNFAYKR